ncbi:MAG: PDZ domain-containing protein [Gemmataceae bacterium]|nr:PDZ domain-containing protein [Gemmataceae bacterium]
MSLRILAIGMIFTCLAFQPATLIAQTKDALKKTDEKKDEPAKSDEKKPDPNKAEEKKEPVYTLLKTKLKTYEEDLAKIRSSMIKDVEVEENRIDDIMAKLEKARIDSMKLKDFKTANEIFGLASKLRSERLKIHMLRTEIDRKVNPTGGFNIPVRKLNEEERVGISTSAPSSVLAQQLGLKKDHGIVIERVEPNSAADKAGLKKHDVLVKIDGNPVAGNPFALRKQLAQLKADAAVEAVVIRGGKEETIKGFTVPAPK